MEICEAQVCRYYNMRCSGYASLHIPISHYFCITFLLPTGIYGCGEFTTVPQHGGSMTPIATDGKQKNDPQKRVVVLGYLDSNQE